MQGGTEVCAVFFDLKKAIDLICPPLVHKLEELGIDRYLLKWIIWQIENSRWLWVEMRLVPYLLYQVSPRVLF